MKKFIYAVLAFAPALAFAQELNNITRMVEALKGIVGKLIPIMVALALVFFFWGLIKYIMKAGDPKEAAAGKSIMIYGVIAIAVMLSIYGLVRFLNTSFGITNNDRLPTPCPEGITCT